jgi:hypothetical protein
MPKHQSWSVSSQESCGGGDSNRAAAIGTGQEVKSRGGRESGIWYSEPRLGY